MKMLRARAAGRLRHADENWADAIRGMKVRANADTPTDARTAPQLRRRGHRPLPHRAHVLRG
ncbi:hypothetical protein ACU4GA_02725 [Methylobacterium oryzae CBMB20]